MAKLLPRLLPEIQPTQSICLLMYLAAWDSSKHCFLSFDNLR